MKLSVRRHSTLQNGVAVFDAETGEELRSYITESGLLFSTTSSSAPSFQEYFPDLEPLLARVDFTKLPYRKSIKYEGNFNWKTMVDGYQECLHCQYTHPSFSVFYPPAFYAVHNHTNFSRHIADPKKPDDGLFLYFFPVVTLNVYGGGMSSFRVCPTEDPGVTREEFLYPCRNATKTDGSQEWNLTTIMWKKARNLKNTTNLFAKSPLKISSYVKRHRQISKRVSTTKGFSILRKNPVWHVSETSLNSIGLSLTIIPRVSTRSLEACCCTA